LSRFKFNLETVLNYRKNLESTAKENLAASLAFYQQEKGMLQKIEVELSQALNPKEQIKLNLDQLLHQEQYQGYLSSRLAEQTIKVNTAQGQVTVRRRELEQKMQERKVIESLRDKKFQEFTYLKDQAEQKAIDDMAVNGYIRQNRKD